MKSRALTLIEILVVAAIIVLLVAITFPIMSRAKTAAAMSASTNNLHQIHVALTLYRDNEGDYPLQNLDVLVDQGFLKEKSVLHIPLDPVKPGFANRLYECAATSAITVPKYRTSYEDIFLNNAKPDGSRVQLYLDMVRPHDNNPSLVATRIFGDKNPSDPSTCRGVTTSYDGLVLRVREAGNVERGRYVDVDASGNRRYCWPAIFTHIDPNIICERP